LRRKAWWGAILFALPIAFVVVAVFQFDPNEYKAALARAVQDATGRTFALNGKMRLRWSLQPSFEVADVTLANLPQGTRPDMARAESIQIEISLLSLLWRQIEVVKLTLVGPNVLFEQVNGVPNWVFTPEHPAVYSAPSAPTSSGLPLQLRVRSMHIQNGMVTWHLPARTKVLGIRSLDAAHSTDDGPLALSATLVYADNQPFSIKASAQPTADFSGPWTTQIAFAAFDTTATARGTMDLAGAYDLHVDGSSGNLDKLNALLPEMSLPPISRMTLATHLTNGRVPGDLPVIGETRLNFTQGDLGAQAPSLKLGAFNISLPAAGGLATIDGTADVSGHPFKLTGTVGVPLYMDARNTVKLDMKADATAGKGAGSSATIKGKLELDTLVFAGLDASLSSRIPDLTAWRDLASRLPALSDARFDGQIAVPANAGALRIRAATLATRAFTVTGEGTVGLGARSALQAKLHAGDLALAPLLDAFGITPPALGAATSTTGLMIPDTSLPWSGLRAVDLDLQGRVDALTAADHVWREVDMAVQLNDGRLRMGSLKSTLPAGPLELAVTADASRPEVPVTLSLRSPGVPLALITHYAGLTGDATGSVLIDAQLRGNGATPRGLAASLNGPISVTAIGGELSNAMLIELTSASLEALGITVPAQGRTSLDCLGLIGSFENGVGRFRTIALKTTYLSLDGGGEIDLGKETIALKLKPLAQVSGSPVEVPVIVEGAFRNISGRLDATGLDKVGLLIDGMFGGDTSQACRKAGLTPTRAP
jgi:uncharacterized protein involved in outer membrane biogenesis